MAVFATGEILYQAMEAAEMLAWQGIEASVFSVHTLKPFDTEGLLQAAKKYPLLCTVEEHSVIGGLGSLVSENLAENGCGNRLVRVGFEDCFAKGYGNRQQVLAANDLDGNGIYQRIIQALN